MRFISFQFKGQDCYGVLDGGKAFPVTKDFLGRYPTLVSAIAGRVTEQLELGNSLGLSDLQILTPIPDPKKIICVGLNYAKKYPVEGQAPSLPTEPVVFARFKDTLVAHKESLQFPKMSPASESYDYEGEIVAIIGEPAWQVSEAQALSHVFGYSIMNEGSVRGYQKHSVHAGKNFYRSGSWGPWITSVNDAKQIEEMELETWVNDELRQKATGDQMIFSLGKIVSYLSHLHPLSAGDIIATGSPEGSGGTFKQPKFLRSGDTVCIKVTSLGTLINKVN